MAAVAVAFQDFVETHLTAFGGDFEVIRADATDMAVTASRIVQVDNATPILLSRESSFIAGIRGMAARCSSSER